MVLAHPKVKGDGGSLLLLSSQDGPMIHIVFPHPYELFV